MKEGFYFPHYQDARRDIKVLRLRKDLGIEGYGIFFMLLEILREQPNFKFPLQDIDLLVQEIQTTKAKLEVVISGYDLFETECTDNGEVFFSPKQISYLLPYIQRKEQSKNANKNSQNSRKQKVASQIKQLSLLDSTLPIDNSVKLSQDDLTSQIRTNKNKEEQIKEEETTTNACAHGARSSFEEWIKEKCQMANNPIAYSHTLRQKYNNGEQSLLDEFSQWGKKNARNKELMKIKALSGKFLNTKNGILEIAGVEYEQDSYKIYFVEGGYANVSSVSALPILDTRNA